MTMHAGSLPNSGVKNSPIHQKLRRLLRLKIVHQRHHRDLLRHSLGLPPLAADPLREPVDPVKLSFKDRLARLDKPLPRLLLPQPDLEPPSPLG